jgi:alkylation response protein AidB-like acyl-CoA dehydrogenase
MTDAGGAVDLPEAMVRLKARVRDLVEREVIPHERAGELPPDALARVHGAMRELGIWGAGMPAEEGGAGLGTLCYLLVSEELARTTLYVPLFEAGHAIPALTQGTPEQKRRYLHPTMAGELRGAFALTEPQGGSDPGRTMRTTAVERDGGWTIDGRKTFVADGDVADYVIVCALTDAAKRQRGGMTLFIVDRGTPGLSIGRTIEMMGAYRAVELDLTGCRVPDGQRLGPVGEGFRLAQETIGPERLWFGAYAVGVCSRLIDMACSYAASREVFGRPLSEQGQTHAMLSQCATEVEACRWLVYRAGAEADRGRDVRLLTSMVKVYAGEMVSRVADQVLQLFGGWGYSTEYPIERFYRDSRHARIGGGPTELHRYVIARELFRRAKDLADG